MQQGGMEWEGFEKGTFSSLSWVLRLWIWTSHAISHCEEQKYLQPLIPIFLAWDGLRRILLFLSAVGKGEGCNPLADGLPLPSFSSMQIRPHTDTGQPDPQACHQHQHQCQHQLQHQHQPQHRLMCYKLSTLLTLLPPLVSVNTCVNICRDGLWHFNR